MELLSSFGFNFNLRRYTVELRAMRLHLAGMDAYRTSARHVVNNETYTRICCVTHHNSVTMLMLASGQQQNFHS